jgi:hypothetical protein
VHRDAQVGHAAHRRGDLDRDARRAVGVDQREAHALELAHVARRDDRSSPNFSSVTHSTPLCGRSVSPPPSRMRSTSPRSSAIGRASVVVVMAAAPFVVIT